MSSNSDDCNLQKSLKSNDFYRKCASFRRLSLRRGSVSVRWHNAFSRLLLPESHPKPWSKALPIKPRQVYSFEAHSENRPVEKEVRFQPYSKVIYLKRSSILNQDEAQPDLLRLVASIAR